MATKEKKPITVKDLEKLVEELKEQFSTDGHDDTFGIDHIQGAQDGRTGPCLTILANDAKGYTWHCFERGGKTLREFLESKGWKLTGQMDGDLIDIYRNEEHEGRILSDGPPDRGIAGQFQSYLRSCYNATVVVVHDDLACMLRHMHDGRGSMHIASLVWKLACEFPHVMAMVRTHKREDQGVDFVFKYLYNAHGIMLCERDMPQARRALGRQPKRKLRKTA